jgi:glycosyltransferase involved in cell wall biosynthesis
MSRGVREARSKLGPLVRRGAASARHALRARLPRDRSPEGPSVSDEGGREDALLRLREQNRRVDNVRLGFEVALDRAPSDAELSEWLDRFDDGFHPWDLVSSLVAGQERRAAASESAEAGRRLIDAAYQRYLGREPSGAELSSWSAQLDVGADPWAVLPAIAGSEEAEMRRAATQREQLRSAWLGFEVALRRAPSDAELSEWLDRFDDGFRPWDLVSSLIAGEERRAAPSEWDEALRELVRAGYRRYLFREPSDAELRAWDQQIEEGFSPWAVLGAIAASDEADVDQTVGALPSAALAASVLEPLYGRGLSPAELSEWKHTLDSGKLRRTEFLLQAMQNHVRRSVAEQSADEGADDPQHVTMMGTTEPVSPQLWEARAAEIAAEPVPVAPRAATESRPYASTGRPRVSVLVSLFRGGRYIERFLDMMVRQTMASDVEVIIIDAQSPENESATIRRYQESHPNIVYRRMDHRIGIYAAWNIGVSMARGEYITNANMDDLRAPDSFERQAEVLDRYPWVDVVYQDFLYTLDDTLDFETVARFGFKSDLPIVTPANLMRYNSPHNAPMWRKSLHDEVGLFDEYLRSAGDYEFWLRCVARDKVFFKINRPHVAYFQNPIGMSTKPDGPGAEEGARVLRKHARSVVPSLHFADDGEFLSSLEELCGESLAPSDSEPFYALAQRALERTWWSVAPAGEDSES